jgi:hypothetical protein
MRIHDTKITCSTSKHDHNLIRVWRYDEWLPLTIREYPRVGILTKGEEDGTKGRRAIRAVVRVYPTLYHAAR